MISARRVAFALVLLGLVYALAVWAPAIANGDPPTVPVTTSIVSRPALVDGHDVAWWARRARRNGDRMRTLQAALRGHVGLSARRLANVSPRPDGLVKAFLCIHAGESGWDSSTNPKYHGGLQMDDGFQSTYGAAFARAWGPAYNWPPFVQVTVAMNAYLSGRGFWPWPTSARACGLLP